MSDMMTETVALLNLIAASRVVAARDAVVDTLARRFPEVKLQAHPGKLDMADVLKEGVFTAPSIHIAVARLKNEERSSGDQDLPLHFRAYVVAENRTIGGKLFLADEVGYALVLGLLDALELQQVARWGLENIGLPEGAEGEPLFTLKTFDRGTVYYVVTWRQTLYREGRMLPHLGGYNVAPLDPFAPAKIGGWR
jgi:hypothetical protein